VAVAGVEGEPVNLTEETTVAIAAAFAAWLVDKKLPSTTKLCIAIGHDSRISAASLQVLPHSSLYTKQAASINKF
jgi:phosphomannomutase